jgi:hypothetical protein
MTCVMIPELCDHVEGCIRQGHASEAMASNVNCIKECYIAIEKRADLHRAEIEDVVRRTIEACEAKCAELVKVFASPEYTTGQPMASFAERFAVESCIEEIRALATDPAALERIIKGERE